MKKIVLTTVDISDCEFEKFRFEAIMTKKSVQDVIRGRLFSAPFHPEVELAFAKWLEGNIQNIMNEV